MCDPVWEFVADGARQPRYHRHETTVARGFDEVHGGRIRTPDTHPVQIKHSGWYGG
jgi:hypothetical protein